MKNELIIINRRNDYNYVLLVNYLYSDFKDYFDQINCHFLTFQNYFQDYLFNSIK